MANKKITYDLQINTAKSANSLGQLETSLDEMKNSIKNVEFGTQEFKKLQRQISATESQLKNVELGMEGLDFEQVASHVGSLAGAAGAVTAAFTIMGDESDESLKEMQENINQGIALFMGIQGAIEGVMASMKLMRVAQVALNNAMKANPIGVIVTGAIALTTAMVALEERFDIFSKLFGTYNEEAELATELTDKANKEFAKEAATLKVLEKRIQAAGKGTRERRKLIKKLNDDYKEYLPNLITEKDTNQDIADAVGRINKQLMLKFKIAAAEEMLTDIYKEQFEIIREMNKEAEPGLFTKLLGGLSGPGGRATAQNTQIALLAKDYGKLEEKAKSLLKFLVTNQDALPDFADSAVEPIEQTREEIDKTIKQTEELRGYVERLGIEWRELPKNVKLDELNQELRVTLQYLTMMGATDAEKTDVVKLFDKKMIQEYEKEVKELLIILEELNKADISSEISSSAIYSNLVGDEKVQDKIDETKQKIKDYIKAIRELKTQLEEDPKKKTFFDSLGEFFNSAEWSMVLDGLHSATNLMNNLMDLQATQSQNRINELERQKEAQISALNSEERVHQEVFSGKEAIEKEYNAKMEAERQAQFEREKNLAYVSAIMNGAEGITAIWAKWAEYPPVAIALTAIEAAAVAAEVGTISSAQYARGGIIDGPSHAMGGVTTPFGEVEGNEAIINKNSTTEYTPLLSAVNEAGGGDRFASNEGMEGFAEMIGSAVNRNIKAHVVSHEMTDQQKKDKRLRDLGKIN